jgi:ADP-ribose pyrophosphatase
MSRIDSREVVFSVPWFDVVAKVVAGEDPNDPYYTLELDDYVSVVAVTEEGQILLVRQYRPTTESYTLELPSGHVENGESPETAGVRELLEETGYEAREVEFLGCLVPDVGRLDNHMWCYFTPDVRPSEQQVPVEEGIELEICSPEELARYITEGHLDHALDLAVILLAMVKGLLPIPVSK